jgi:crotonobetainyl-CoA:carnitine CoA-transferase CaiB-like acyl-CoA transferase
MSARTSSAARFSQFFQAFNYNKKSVALDLKHPGGLAAFRELAAAPMS